MIHHSSFAKWHKPLRMFTVLAMLLGMFAPLAQTSFAASVSQAQFLPAGPGAIVAPGPNGTPTVYAKNGAQLMLNVTTDASKCVELTGAHTATQTSGTAKTSWSFPLAANTGSGVQTVTATAYANLNPNAKCTADRGEKFGTQTASYTLDNNAPTTTSDAPSGWSKTSVTIKLTASDGTQGSGVASSFYKLDGGAQTTYTASGIPVSGEGVHTIEFWSKDNLGNEETPHATTQVKIDAAAPTLNPVLSGTQGTNGWYKSNVSIAWNCADANLTSCTDGGTALVTTEGANQSFTGTATDAAGNSASKSVSVSIDKTAPTLSGKPTNANLGNNGWYTGDVTIQWTATDSTSGVVATPANSTITGEGENLFASASVSDKAGNTTNADSAKVKIDRTAPTTGINGTSNQWVNGSVNVTLSPNDAGSGVASTSYTIDGGSPQTGTSFSLSSEGDHVVTYWSTDKAGNVEDVRTARVKIDKTAPTIRHEFTPSSYADGAWTNQNVTVTFVCADQGGSGVASCTDPVTKTTEGANQQVGGTATDGAGNSATDTATVSIDKTAPTVEASVDRAANNNGWYNDDVTVNFSASDELSGIDTKSAGTTLGEGANQSFTGTATDAAGNSASATISSINVDKTAPSLSGTPSATGWSNGDVTVTWNASDGLSGLASAAPAPSIVKGEGDNLSASASVSDRAGNTTSTTVSGIKIDRTAPSTQASVPAPLATGWYAGDVQVTLTTGADLSGVDKTYYQVGNDQPQVYSGPFNFGTKGVSTITFWSVDNAGNVEDKTGNSITLKIDGTPPTTTISLPAAFTTGWNGDAVPVAFAATDLESGVKKTYYQLDGGAATEWDGKLLVLLDGTHTVTFWSDDVAGNVENKDVASNTYTIKVDTVPPTITGSRTPAANDFGWNNTDVTVKFVCADAMSGLQEGIAGCTPDTPVTNEGAGQSVTGEAIDNAGHRATTTVGDINIDKTAPKLTGAATTDPNAFGWYKGDVTIKWTGQDGLSGIDSSTQPADSTITGEGSNLRASASISDKAGNTGNGSVSDIKIDRTAPKVSGKTVNDDGTPRSPNTAGWFTSAVRVRFTGEDTLSGIQEVSSDVVLSRDGANQSASGTATDEADNSASATVSGINIDSKAPTSAANIQCEGKNNFCRGAKATIALSAIDQDGLSGVKEIRYSTDAGKTWTTITGASGSFDITLNRSGKVSVQFKAVDVAGNVEIANVIEVKYDTIAPTVSHKLAPEANADGWNNADTTVTFSAEDDSDGSGVDAATLTKPVVVSTETAAQVVNGEAYDLAGNKGTDSVTVKLDKTAPTISGAATTPPNADGWYNGPVTVKFTSSDTLSGIASSTTDVVLSTGGANQSVTGTATDKAGNTASFTVSGINIDTTAPAITVNGIANGAIYKLGAVPAASCSATDGGSGLAGDCKLTVTGGNANGAGTFTYSATATDKAGNTTTVTGSYRVTYRWDGFLQPINDTAHQVDQTTSIFKGGSTIPAKFQLKKADGTVVQASSLPQWLTPVKGSATSAPVDESVYSDPATSGTTYRWDSTAQQYIYNWNTKGSTIGYYYRIGVTLDDGQTYYVNIGLR